MPHCFTPSLVVIVVGFMMLAVSTGTSIFLYRVPERDLTGTINSDSDTSYVLPKDCHTQERHPNKKPQENNKGKNTKRERKKEGP